MSEAGSAAQGGGPQTVASLVEVGNLDTLYRDLYLQRAGALMGQTLPRATYLRNKETFASLEQLERQLRAAIERGDWKRAGELTWRVRHTRESAAAAGQAMALAKFVYEGLAEVTIDPFSPGLHVFHRDSADTLREWQRRAIAILSELERADSERRDFYARRRAYFQNLNINLQAEQKKVTATPADLRHEALSALDSGDLSQLDRVMQRLLQGAEAEGAKQDTERDASAVAPAEAEELGEDLNYSFSRATVEAAGRLGLAPARTTSRRHFAYLRAYGWRPSLLEAESKKWARDQLSRLSLPDGSGDPTRDTLEMYLLNPFITSAGTRYLVPLVEEDLLVEDFPEPEPKAPVPRTGLLAALGLENRWGLTRVDIENALMEHGPRVLKEELGLDPEPFRLVAIPPDVYANLGAERGWGRQEMWTHFDGYWVREGGRLQALAGGDRRFGGINDMISFPPTYTSDKILARFAVLQRRRMASWQQQ